MHSLTKGIGGFGTDMGGAVLGPERMRNVLLMYRKDFGGVLSPKPAWGFLVHGLPTLATRMEAAQKTAFRVASWLEAHPKIERVAYPGLESFKQGELAHRQLMTVRGQFAPGLMIYFELKDPAGDGSTGARMIDWIAENAYAITLAAFRRPPRRHPALDRPRGRGRSDRRPGRGARTRMTQLVKRG